MVGVMEAGLRPGRIDAAHVGHAFAPFSACADAWRLRQFAVATGQSDAAYVDPKAARALGYPALPLPPTFLFCLEMDAPNPDSLLELLGLDPRQRLLHAEQGFTYHRMAWCGEPLIFSQRLEQVHEKRGGALQFAVRTTRVTDERGEAVADLRHVIVAVHDAGASTTGRQHRAGSTSESQVAPASHSPAISELLTDPIRRVDLALYAGASGDHNPVHVDIDFAREAGFDDVFVHGMLVMAHAARALTDRTPQSRLRSFDMRFQRITEVGEKLRIESRIDGDAGTDIEPLLRVELSVRGAEGAIQARGRAAFASAR